MMLEIEFVTGAKKNLLQKLVSWQTVTTGKDQPFFGAGPIIEAKIQLSATTRKKPSSNKFLYN